MVKPEMYLLTRSEQQKTQALLAYQSDMVNSDYFDVVKKNSLMKNVYFHTKVIYNPRRMQ